MAPDKRLLWPSTPPALFHRFKDAIPSPPITWLLVFLLSNLGPLPQKVPTEKSEDWPVGNVLTSDTQYRRVPQQPETKSGKVSVYLCLEPRSGSTAVFSVPWPCFAGTCAQQSFPHIALHWSLMCWFWLDKSLRQYFYNIHTPQCVCWILGHIINGSSWGTGCYIWFLTWRYFAIKSLVYKYKRRLIMYWKSLLCTIPRTKWSNTDSMNGGVK